MVRKVMLSIMVVLLVLVSACTAVPTQKVDHQQEALTALQNFFSSLNSGDYASAVALYGGSYEMVAGMNPEVNINDPVSLFTNGCTINGYMCLKIKEAALKEQKSNSEYVFTVKFENPDGSLFVQGPCCGQTEAESPSKSEFLYTVKQNSSGQFVVMDMPPYVP